MSADSCAAAVVVVVAELLGQALILNSSMIIDRRIELEDVQEIPYEVTLSAASALRLPVRPSVRPRRQQPRDK